MIQLPNNIQPDQTVLDKLKAWQLTVLQNDNATERPYAEQVDEAKKQFKSQNRIGNAVFDVVKEKLTQMCSGAKRCVYCEDSKADEVEHIWPKNLYPELVFVWENYIYACGPCNGQKNNNFKIRKSDGSVAVLGGRLAPQKPPTGVSLLVNPRMESGLAYLQLNIYQEKVLKFEVKSDSPDQAKSEWTLELLKNLTDETVGVGRKEAYEDYKARLTRYSVRKNEGVAQTTLNTMIRNLKSKQHPSVWAEMKRQFSSQPSKLQRFDPELFELFSQNPEALHW